MKIIGIAGPAGAGKTTVAGMIQQMQPGYDRLAFSTPIKEMLRVGLGLSEAQLYGDQKEVADPRYGCTPRHLMQTLGTEWGRNMINQDIWLNATISKICGPTVVEDVRFFGEADWVRKHGALLHVARNGLVTHRHESEAGIQPAGGDYFINNSFGLGDLEQQVENFLASLDLGE